MNNQGDAAYELEIDATAEEVQKLIELFNEWEEFDEENLFPCAYSNNSISP